MVMDILDMASTSKNPNIDDDLDKFLGLALENLPKCQLSENQKLDAILNLMQKNTFGQELEQLESTIERLKSLE
jgi:hypothetical protein